MTPADQTWVTSKGVHIPISHMTDEHLSRTKDMIARRNWFLRFPQYHRICREIEARHFARKLP